MTCVLCEKEIRPGTAAISAVGGMFPAEDPDFFMVDEAVMKEAHVHRDCFILAIKEGAQSCYDSESER